MTINNCWSQNWKLFRNYTDSFYYYYYCLSCIPVIPVFITYQTNLNTGSTLPSTGLPANKFIVNHQFVPRNLRYCSPYRTFNFALTISHSLIFCFQFLFYVLVLVFCYLRMRLCNGFKLRIFTLALKTFRSSQRYI